ncbi:MAG: NAD(P)-dependent oxidoreductase [Alphaproteobacteria bacterium]|nr:NAD(P)-dependent oxidoreductase [Alphaproteobacteria bacterium]
MSAKSRIGFIGAGLMGHGAAANLVAKGFRLSFLAHRNRKAAEDLLARGAIEVASARDLAKGSDIVFLCLPSSVEVEAVTLGAQGLVEGAHAGSIVVDMTTADPASTLRIAAALGERGVRMIDAPLGRTPKDAEEGRLNAMVGGDAATIALVRPALATFCENIFHVGPLGAGHTLKLVNNYLALANAPIVAEGIIAAARAGVDLAVMRDVVVAGGADSAVFRVHMRAILDGDTTVGEFAIANARKDVDYYARMVAPARGVGMMVGPALQTFNLLCAQGHGGEYMRRFTPLLAGINGVKLPPAKV